MQHCVPNFQNLFKTYFKFCFAILKKKLSFTFTPAVAVFPPFAVDLAAFLADTVLTPVLEFIPGLVVITRVPTPTAARVQRADLTNKRDGISRGKYFHLVKKQSTVSQKKHIHLASISTWFDHILKHHFKRIYFCTRKQSGRVYTFPLLQ